MEVWIPEACWVLNLCKRPGLSTSTSVSGEGQKRLSLDYRNTRHEFSLSTRRANLVRTIYEPKTPRVATYTVSTIQRRARKQGWYHKDAQSLDVLIETLTARNV